MITDTIKLRKVILIISDRYNINNIKSTPTIVVIMLISSILSIILSLYLHNNIMFRLVSAIVAILSYLAFSIIVIPFQRTLAFIHECGHMIAYLLIDSTSNPHIHVHSKLKYRMIGTGITNCDIPLSKFQTVFVASAGFFSIVITLSPLALLFYVCKLYVVSFFFTTAIIIDFVIFLFESDCAKIRRAIFHNEY